MTMDIDYKHATIARDGQVTRIGGRDMPEVL